MLFLSYTPSVFKCLLCLFFMLILTIYFIKKLKIIKNKYNMIYYIK
jgi:hypothetical protein